jgi:tetratricopeptide (TPR) repeat protein
MTGRVLNFPKRSGPSDEDHVAARRILGVSISDRLTQATQLEIDKPENLLSLCASLREQLYTSPATARDDAEFFYRFLESPKRRVGLFDEREYFLGEFALIAGTACRQISRRDEARLWFDRAELAFRGTASAKPDMSRLAYQRLALRIEERQLSAVLELAPSLRQSFEELNMAEEALKCHFLEGIALAESDRVEESIPIFEEIGRRAAKLGNERLVGLAFTNLTQYHGMRGNSVEAITWSRRAIPILERLDDRVGLAKVHWGLANLLRESHQTSAAVDAYRAAQLEFESLQMRADVAALRLVIADLLVELGRRHEAMREILASLPVIEELKMVPEGMAALSLLRESVRQKQINRQALRDLHGYFEDLKS